MKDGLRNLWQPHLVVQLPRGVPGAARVDPHAGDAVPGEVRPRGLIGLHRAVVHAVGQHLDHGGRAPRPRGVTAAGAVHAGGQPQPRGEAAPVAGLEEHLAVRPEQKPASEHQAGGIAAQATRIGKCNKGWQILLVTPSSVFLNLVA